MESMNFFLTAILPLLGVALGASLQYYFSRSSEQRTQLSTLRIQAYTNYLQCVAESTKAALDHQKMREILVRAADAKARISIYGSAAVLNALAHFEKSGAVIKSPETAQTFLQIIAAMRQEAAGKNDLAKLDDIKIVIFGNGEIET